MVMKFIPIYKEIFELPNFFLEPFLTLGYQGMFTEGWTMHPDLQKIKNYLTYEKSNIIILDLFDPRAHLKFDLNLPVPEDEHEKYQTLVDIGTLEHIFDTKQAFENCLRMVKIGGLYFLHTPVRGYFRHGFHTFHPELILHALKLNNFEIIYLRYSTRAGKFIVSPSGGEDVLIWVVAKKLKSINKFIIPQQKMWNHYYDTLK